MGPRLSNPDGTLYPSARTFPDLVDAIGHGLLGMVAPGNRFTRRYRHARLGPPPIARVDWVSGACFLVRRRPGTRSAASTRRISCTWRTSTCAGGWPGPGGRSATSRGAEVMHVQGVSTNQHPYRMLAAHHRSMWRFAWRTTVGPRTGRSLPLVAVAVWPPDWWSATVRHGLGRRPEPSRAVVPGGRVDLVIGPGDRYPERRYGQGFIEQEGGARRRYRRRAYAPGAHSVDVLQRPGRRGRPRDPRSPGRAGIAG